MRGFTSTKERHSRTVDQYRFNFGRLGEVQDRVGIPIAAGDTLPVKLDLLVQGPAGSLGEAALQLVAQSISADDLTRISGDDCPLQVDVPTFPDDLELDRHSGIALPVFVLGEGDPPTSPLALTGFMCLPAHFLRSCLENRAGTLVLEMVKAKFQRVDAS